jgi:hypothetical protein
MAGRDILGWTLVAVMTLVIIGPMVVVGLWAFAEVWRFPALLPQEFGLKFWHITLARADVWDALWTSIRLATIVTLISAAICLPAAYAFARMELSRPQHPLSLLHRGQCLPPLRSSHHDCDDLPHHRACRHLLGRRPHPARGHDHVHDLDSRGRLPVRRPPARGGRARRGRRPRPRLLVDHAAAGLSGHRCRAHAHLHRHLL